MVLILQLTMAEVRNTVMLAEHNAPLSMTDHIGPMAKKNFPDSDIAQSYHSARTKTACILNHAVAPDLKRQLVAAMQEQPYSLSTDASSDTGLSKMNLLTVRIFYVNRNVVTQKFLDLCLTSGEDAGRTKSIFDKINDTLSELNIRATGFRGETQFDVEACCIDHYYWFDNSTMRKSGIEKHAEFCDTEYRGFIKNVNVGWLSLQKAVERILKLYTLSRTYFLSEGLKEARFIRLLKLYENPMNEIYLLFYQAALPAFTTFNLYLQRNSPQIYTLHGQMQILLRKMLTKFILPFIRDTPELADINY